MSGSAWYRHTSRQHLAVDSRMHQELEEVFGCGVPHHHNGVPIGLQGSLGKPGAEIIYDPRVVRSPPRPSRCPARTSYRPSEAQCGSAGQPEQWGRTHQPPPVARRPRADVTCWQRSPGRRRGRSGHQPQGPGTGVSYEESRGPGVAVSPGRPPNSLIAGDPTWKPPRPPTCSNTDRAPDGRP